MAGPRYSAGSGTRATILPRSSSAQPARAAAGFDQLVVKGKATLPSNFFHYLHHRYFECNYGDPMLPFDRWFGTFHDGTPQAHARMQQRWAEKRA